MYITELILTLTIVLRSICHCEPAAPKGSYLNVPGADPVTGGNCFAAYPRLLQRFTWEQLQFFCQQARQYHEDAYNITKVELFTDRQQEWIDSFTIDFSAETPMSDRKPAVRQEIHVMSNRDFQRFTRAILKLKNKTIDGVSLFDLLVRLHQPAIAPGSYVGPAFLPWHHSGRPHSPQYIQGVSNTLFARHDIDVHMNKCLRVSHKFTPRTHALSRTYIYRLAVIRREHYSEYHSAEAMLPLSERNRCWVIEPGFDVALAQKAADLFQGEMNVFSFVRGGFTHYHTPNSWGIIDEVRPTKRVYDVRIEPSQSYSPLPNEYDNNVLSFYTITYVASSFVREQIRRMTALLVAVGKHLVTLQEVEDLIKRPSNRTFHELMSRKVGFQDMSAPASGLYLAHVNYDPKHFWHPFRPYNKNSWQKKNYWTRRIGHNKVRFADEELNEDILLLTACGVI